MRWDAPDFLAEAEAWIVAEAPAAITGPLEQTHLQPWSTVLRVPTGDGVLWFKANAPVHRFEARLTERLVAAAPDRVVELVATHAERDWLLMRDAGTRLRDVDASIAQLRHWERLLPLYAELQQSLASSEGDLVALGAPDHRLRWLPALLQEVLDDEEALLVGQEDGVSAEELVRLRAFVPETEAMCVELAAFGIPETLQHDDFHDGQVYLQDGRYRFLDWGDSCVSHPFHTMVVTIRAFAYKHGLEPGGVEVLRLRDAYLEPFGPGQEPAFDLAYRTGTLARSLAWYRYVVEGPGLEYADSVAYGLKLFLAGGPIGSWEPPSAP
jgi:hypothetical protein